MRYLIFIPELQLNDVSDQKPSSKSNHNGVWCYNRINNFSRYTDTQLRNKAKTNSFGSYTPLKPGTRVIIHFKEDDYNSGYIEGIINYDSPPNKDRDDFYLMMVTDKSSWAFFDETGEQFAVSWHHGKSNIWGKDDIIHVSKDSGTVVEVQDEHITIFNHDGSYIHIDDDHISVKAAGAYVNIINNGDISINAPGNIDIKSGGDLNLAAGGNVNIQAGGNISGDGSTVNFNCSASSPASPTDPGVKTEIAKPSLDAIEEINSTDESEHTFFDDT